MTLRRPYWLSIQDISINEILFCQNSNKNQIRLFRLYPTFRLFQTFRLSDSTALIIALFVLVLCQQSKTWRMWWTVSKIIAQLRLERQMPNGPGPQTQEPLWPYESVINLCQSVIHSTGSTINWSLIIGSDMPGALGLVLCISALLWAIVKRTFIQVKYRKGTCGIVFRHGSPVIVDTGSPNTWSWFYGQKAWKVRGGHKFLYLN